MTNVKHSKVVKRGSTLFLKTVVGLMALVVLAFSTLLLPRAIIAEFSGDFDYAPILIVILITSLLFLTALYRTLKLLSLIDRNKAFSESSVKVLKDVKVCAAAISLLYTASLPYVFIVADRDDAPGVVAVALVLAGASFVVATAAAVFQRLLQSAVDLKAENDLTV